MLISHRKRFIYTKTIKTAGTSVESYFERYCVPEGLWEFCGPRDEQVSTAGIIGYRGPEFRGKQWRNHMSAGEIRHVIGESIWSSYFKFCVIRNPFDKLVSAFYFLERQRENQVSSSPSKNHLRRFYKKLGSGNDLGAKDPVERFRNWLRRGGAILDRDKYLIDGEICVDYLIRFEDLHAGIKHVCSVLDIAFEPEKIPQLKTGIRNREIRLHEYYDSQTIEIVRKLYKFELNTFGYSAPAE